jgi:hypothetical protein
LGRFFQFWLGFFGLSRFFSGLGSVRFFQFQTYKTETEPVGFFKILIGLIDFFHGLVFSVIFFYFLGLVGFLIFLPTLKYTSGKFLLYITSCLRWSVLIEDIYVNKDVVA